MLCRVEVEAPSCRGTAVIRVRRVGAHPLAAYPPFTPTPTPQSAPQSGIGCSSYVYLSLPPSFANRAQPCFPTIPAELHRRRQWRQHLHAWPPATATAHLARPRPARCSASFVWNPQWVTWKPGGTDRETVQACDPQNFEPNLALNLEITDLINQKKGSAYGHTTLNGTDQAAHEYADPERQPCRLYTMSTTATRTSPYLRSVYDETAPPYSPHSSPVYSSSTSALRTAATHSTSRSPPKSFSTSLSDGSPSAHRCTRRASRLESSN